MRQSNVKAEEEYYLGFQINQMEEILELEMDNFYKQKEETQKDIAQIDQTNTELYRNLGRIKYKQSEQKRKLEEMEELCRQYEEERQKLNDFINQRPSQSGKNHWIYDINTVFKQDNDNAFYTLASLGDHIYTKTDDKLRKKKAEDECRLNFAYLQENEDKKQDRH